MKEGRKGGRLRKMKEDKGRKQERKTNEGMRSKEGRKEGREKGRKKVGKEGRR